MFACVSIDGLGGVREFKAIFHEVISPIEFVVIRKSTTNVFRFVQLGEPAVDM